ncbi:MAG TPA: amidase [Burkholderiales bacterium]|nr:amidase [Burkholderiales bacterium]
MCAFREFPHPTMSAAEICFMTASDLVGRIRARELSALEVLEAHLAQIDRVNPKVNAIVTLVPDQARAMARNVDAAIARGDDPGPLAGLPVAHKDLAVTKGVRTTFGSPIYKDFVPEVDAIIVERLKKAGAVSLGKTNTPEFGAGSQTFNKVFGATRNPYDLSKTCGGSSGGAAVALACGMVPIADGSDLGGSLRNPASFCNVVGLRPSSGRVPNWPGFSAWFSMTVVGPMARTTQDVALALSAIAGPDSRAPLSLQEPGQAFARPLQRSFKGARIAWSSDLGGLPLEPEVRRIVDAQRQVFVDLGCMVEDATPDLRDADEIFGVMRAWNMELSFGQMLKTRRDQMKDTVIWNIEEGAKLTGPQVGAAEAKRTQLFQRMHDFMGKYDFLVAPVVQVLPFDVDVPYPTEINGTKLANYIEWMRSCYYITVTGAPALSVPCGFSAQGLPVGLQIAGRYHDDFGVLQMGHAFEQATGFWKQRPAIAGA